MDPVCNAFIPDELPLCKTGFWLPLVSRSQDDLHGVIGCANPGLGFDGALLEPRH